MAVDDAPADGSDEPWNGGFVVAGEFVLGRPEAGTLGLLFDYSSLVLHDDLGYVRVEDGRLEDLTSQVQRLDLAATLTFLGAGPRGAPGPGPIRAAVLAGLRVVDYNLLESAAGWADGSGEAWTGPEESETWVEPVAGVLLQSRLLPRLELEARGDVGGAGKRQGTTWSWAATLRLGFSEQVFVAAGWRAWSLDYENPHDLAVDAVLQGPCLGIEVRF
jgi:hypothetical protein